MRLTVQPDGTLGLAERIFTDALIAAKVARAKIPDGKTHVGPEAVLFGFRRVFRVRYDHRFVEVPVAYRARMRLRVTIDRHICTGRCSNQLIWHPDHRGDFKQY